MNGGTVMKDRMLHITLCDGQARGLLLGATNTVGEAERIHKSSPTVTAALGRALMGTAMLGALIKQDDASVTVTIDGGGPIGRLVCVCDGGTGVRGYADEPALSLPLNAAGKLDVGGAVGRDGRISVVKDMKLKAPYVGQVPLVSGEIAEDFAGYYMQSEQSPTVQALGVTVDKTGVLAACGALLQPLPGCTPEVIDALERASAGLGSLSGDFTRMSLEEILDKRLGGLNPIVISESPLEYRCGCSRERMERTLMALGRAELKSIIDDERDGAELNCHFCGRVERFSQEELRELYKEAVRD